MDKEAIARLDRADEILGEKLCALSATLPLFGFFSALENAETYEAVVAAKQALSAAILALQSSERGEGTPAAAWRDKGEPDPHGDRCACERAKLCGGHMTDDEVAFEVAMLCREDLNHEAVLQTAKDRIRWLSRALVSATLSPAEPSPESREGEAEPAIERLVAWAKQHSNVTPLDGTDRDSPTFGDLRAAFRALKGPRP